MTIWGRKSTTTDTDPGLLEGLRLYDAGDFAGSIKFLLTKTRTGDHFAAFKLANALSEVGQVRAAIAYWELAISWGSNDSFNNLGNRYKELGHFDKALELYVKGAEGGSDDAMHSAGVLAFDLERFDESRYWLEKGMEGGNPRCFGVLGKNLLDLGQTDEAIEVLKRGTEQGSLSSYLQLALIYNEQENTSLALKTLLQAPKKHEIDHRENHLLVYVDQLIGAFKLIQAE